MTDDDVLDVFMVQNAEGARFSVWHLQSHALTLTGGWNRRPEGEARYALGGAELLITPTATPGEFRLPDGATLSRVN